jgi:hypothetical protein
MIVPRGQLLARLIAAFHAALIALALTGCIEAKSGDTLYRVDAADLEEEKVIRRKLWHVGKALEDVRVRYALEDITVSVLVTDLGGLGEASPAFSGLANVSGAKVVLSKRLFLEEHPDLDLILTGLIAHEMMHALHYARMPRSDLIELGRRYGAMLRNPEGPQHEWVRAYERLTDMLTIKLGYGTELIHQKRASEANLAANDPPQVWDFYLTEEEIRAMMADPDLLDREIDAAIEIISLPSTRGLRDTPVLLDEDGDLVPLRRR